MPHGAGASRRPYVEHGSRRVHLAGVTANPDGAWMRQQARNLAVEERLENVRYLLHDRDAKFSAPFDALIRSEGVRVIKTPVRAPRANAIAERWVRTVRNECLDHVLVYGRRHLERILRGYADHFNAERPNRSLELAAPAGSPRSRGSPSADILRRDVVGGLIHEYYAAAA
jgi:transposase InsO family protein